MNWLKWLKSNAGKLQMSTQKALIVSASVGIVGATLMQNLIESPSVQDTPVRSLSSVSNDFNYGSMRYTDNGTGLTSINVADENGTIDTSRGSSSAPGDFGLKAADNMDETVSASLRGQGSALGDTEGLGKSRDVDLTEYSSGTSADTGRNSASTSHSYSPRSNGTADYDARNGGHSAEPTQIASLGTASMTRASGSGINASYGNSSGSSSSASRSGSSRSSGGKSSGSSYNFSGAMPSGTNPVSLSGADGRSSSHFMAGTTQATVVGGRNQSSSIKNELRDISKRSADAARLASLGNASNTEGSRAWLAGQGSNGLEIGQSDAIAPTESQAGSNDPDASSIRSLKKGLQDTGDYLEDFNMAQNNVIMWFINSLIAIAIGMVAIAYISKITSKTLQTICYIAAFGGVMTVIGFMIDKVNNFVGNYPDQPTYWTQVISGILSAGAIGGCLWAYLKPEKITGFLKGIWGKVGKALGLKAVDKVFGLASNAVTENFNYKNSNKKNNK